jgi:hypothetical protein
MRPKFLRGDWGCYNIITKFIIYMKKLLQSDWLRGVQLFNSFYLKNPLLWFFEVKRKTKYIYIYI